jgi:hypothetical protein
MFASQKRREAQALEAIREELSAADLRARAMLADAIAKMELRLTKDLEQRRRMQAATEAAAETLQTSLADNSTEIARALGQVANICAVVAERLEADRLERRAFTEAIARVTRPPIAKADGPSRIIGGTFFATSEIAEEDEISLVEGDDEATTPTIATEAPPTTAMLPNTTLEVSANGLYRQRARESDA